MNRNLVSFSSLAVALVLLFAVNIFERDCCLEMREWEMTEQQLYTLTPGSRGYSR